MGLDKRLVNLWEKKPEDVVTALKVLKYLDIIKEEDITFLTETMNKIVLTRSANK